MTGPPQCLVTSKSATSCLPGGVNSDHARPINRTHSDLVKFGLRDPSYGVVRDVLVGIGSKTWLKKEWITRTVILIVVVVVVVAVAVGVVVGVVRKNQADSLAQAPPSNISSSNGFPSNGSPTNGFPLNASASTFSGFFNTEDLVSWQTGVTDEFKAVRFDRLYVQAPAVAVGLSKLDIQWGKNPRIRAYADNITRDGMSIHIAKVSDTSLGGGACYWLHRAKDDPNFQIGDFQSDGDNSTSIAFERAFTSAPSVIVWLKGFDMDKRYTARIRVYADSVTATGFQLRLETWGDTVLNWVSVSWIAHRTDL